MPTESLEEFAERHGGDPVHVGGRYLFSDGAQSNGHDHIEPPDNPRALITLQIDYLTAKLHEEEQRASQAVESRRVSFGEFAERQGCARVLLRGRHVFENGAQWAALGGVEPPDDPVALLDLQSEFLASRLDQEERKFNRCHEYITAQSTFHSHGAGPAPPEGAFTDLEQFAANVKGLREKLDVKQAELFELRGPTPEQRYAEKRNEQRATAHNAIQRAIRVEI